MRATAIAAAFVIGLGVSVAVVTPAVAETQMVCQRQWGGYSITPLGNSVTWPWVAFYQTTNNSWSQWLPTDGVQMKGQKLPTGAPTSVYAYYANWNGTGWEFHGEWAYVTNGRGEIISYVC